MSDILDTEELLKKAVNYVLQLLSKKEYSVLEMTRKLNVRYPEEVVQKCVAYCKEKNYLSDERFASMFVRFRFHSNYGPMRIRYELKEKGINEDIAEETLDNPEYDFEETLLDLAIRKSANLDLKDYKERTKLVRHLVSRGFESSSVIKIVSRLSNKDVDEM